VFVELVCDVLSWDPTAQVFVLHFLDPLDGIFGDCVQRAHDAAVWEGVSLLSILKDVAPKTCGIDSLSTGQLGPMNVTRFGMSGMQTPRYASGQTFHLSARSTPSLPTMGNLGR
jgi:hypothetical protein